MSARPGSVNVTARRTGTPAIATFAPPSRSCPRRWVTAAVPTIGATFRTVTETASAGSERRRVSPCVRAWDEGDGGPVERGGAEARDVPLVP